MSNSDIPYNIISKALVKDSKSLTPPAIIEILELDLTEVKFINKNISSSISDYYYFHNSSIYGDVVIKWGSDTDPTGLGVINVYPMPFELTGLEQSNMQLPRPTLKISNYKEYLTFLLIELGNLTGAKIIRHRTLVKYLNNRRVRYADEIFFINKKNKENRNEIEFELASSLELEGDKLPKRQIMGDYCGWKYRSDECEYANVPMCDKNSVFFSSSATPPGYSTYGMDAWDTNTDGGEYNKGLWDDTLSTDYNYRDFVRLEFKGRIMIYVCISVSGAPAGISIFNETYWIADVCPHKLTDCKYHFGLKAVLPFGGFSATNKYNYDPTATNLSD
jgi:lambda family phage minor tail protein L